MVVPKLVVLGRPWAHPVEGFEGVLYPDRCHHLPKGKAVGLFRRCPAARCVEMVNHIEDAGCGGLFVGRKADRPIHGRVADDLPVAVMKQRVHRQREEVNRSCRKVDRGRFLIERARSFEDRKVVVPRGLYGHDLPNPGEVGAKREPEEVAQFEVKSPAMHASIMPLSKAIAVG